MINVIGSASVKSVQDQLDWMFTIKRKPSHASRMCSLREWWQWHPAHAGGDSTDTRSSAASSIKSNNGQETRRPSGSATEWSPERFQSQARAVGPNTEALIIAVLARRPHPEQGFRTCLGILRLYRGIDAVRAEAAAGRA
jgi:hypothetical protein